MRYTRYGILFGLIVVTVGIFLTIRYGYRPAPTPIMKPSFFDRAEEVGAVVMKRFFVPLEQEKVVVFGVPSGRDWSAGVVEGFAAAAAQSRRGFTRVYVERQLGEPLKAAVRRQIPAMVEVDSNSEPASELIDAIRAAKASGEHILIVVPNLYSTHLLPGNPMDRLEKALLLTEPNAPPLFSISLGPLALKPAEEKTLDPACIGTERDGAGTADFGCAIMQAGRVHYRKQLTETKEGARFIAIMQSPRRNDYLLLVREPSSPQ